MRKKSLVSWGIRVLLYVVGLFILAMGVAVSINSGLGVSPMNSLPYVISQASGIAMSTCVIVLFCSYILIQVILLRRDFHPVNLLQILFAVLFGYFVDLAKWMLGEFALPTYAGKLVMLAVSVLLIAVGVVLYIEVELVPMPTEGLTLTVSKKLGRPFPRVKAAIDCVVVAVGIAVSFAAFHRLVGIREGTVVTALAAGRVIALVKRPVTALIQRLCFGSCQPLAEEAEEVEKQQLP
ncbi:hypothetical protein SDC9_88502 [bioreactor metagenome]|uniref:Membrane protein YczE n=1 Tax=bioreactor metagenome TaxID=1076179 RepID=A0A644ZLZ2_9ZZZZ